MAALDPFLEHTRIAYLSMEIALRPEIHTYSGGLGILAGDVRRVLGDFIDVGQLRLLGGPDHLNMTRLALNLSGYVNGVARRHAETTRRLFPRRPKGPQAPRSTSCLLVQGCETAFCAP
jgi:glucan phosphorylase